MTRRDRPPVYLDCNASAPVLPGVAEAVAEALLTGGNPSSVHGFGRRARALMEDAREQVAAMVGAEAKQVIFTSGGTEVAAMALRGLPPGPRLISAIEHPCVLETEPEAERIPVTADGVVDLVWLEKRLAASPVAVVAVMFANNETGVVQPIAEVARLARQAGAKVFCDAVQGPGKASVDFRALDVDALSLSAHKIGGPQGVGALVLRQPETLAPLVRGGGQERGKRGGTQNLPGIAGFAAAARAVVAEGAAKTARMAALRGRLEAEIRTAAPDAVIWGSAAERLPNTTCVGVPGLDQQRQLMALDLAGVAVSAGSACSSGKVAPSHVLMAMGAGEQAARQAIRISLGWQTSEDDLDRFIEAWTPLAATADRRAAG